MIPSVFDVNNDSLVLVEQFLSLEKYFLRIEVGEWRPPKLESGPFSKLPFIGPSYFGKPSRETIYGWTIPHSTFSQI